MNSKSIIIFILVFSIQLLMSCYPCDCNPGIVRGAVYTEGEITALDTSGFKDEIVQDSVHRNSFGLYYESTFELEETSEIKPTEFHGSFGFNSAYACSCTENTFTYADPVVSLDIVMVEDITKEETNINEAFGLFIGTGLQAIDEVDWNLYFNQEWYPEVYLNFELSDEGAVASSSVFKIVLTLESGATLSSETEVVKFFD